MNTLTFRFDIDTHKCMRDGVPNLLDLAEKYDVPFTFFVNTGKAISLWDSLFGKKLESDENIKMMSARKKLGNLDFLEAAILNPSPINYKKQLVQLFNSKCEVGLHGGNNHQLWQKYAGTFGHDKCVIEIRGRVSENQPMN